MLVLMVILQALVLEIIRYWNSFDLELKRRFCHFDEGEITLDTYSRYVISPSSK